LAEGTASARLRVDLLTIFPGYFESPLRESLLGKAVASGLLDVRVHDVRDHSPDPHRSVDDEPYGGGPGMVMMGEPILRAVESLGEGPSRVVVLSPQGRLLDQARARELAGAGWLVLVCGRYEGVDERVVQLLGAEEMSVGDYVLPGGEPAALVVLEAVARLVPGVVGNPESIAAESFEEPLFDHPHYTRPRELRGLDVPEVLLSGDHGRIAAWRRERAREKTRRNRPDLPANEK
jgi:tRNA (guanine37-N1)-methyltransferase